MKKLISTIVLSIILIVAFAQEQVVNEKMDISEIPIEVGILYEKAYIDVGKVKTVEIMILEKTNLTEERTDKYLMLRYFAGGTLGQTYSLFLDKKETESLIVAMEKMILTSNAEKRFTYTVLEFKSSSGLLVGCYYEVDADKWSFYLRDHESISRSIYYLKQDQFISLFNYVRSIYDRI